MLAKLAGLPGPPGAEAGTYQERTLIKVAAKWRRALTNIFSLYIPFFCQATVDASIQQAIKMSQGYDSADRAAAQAPCEQAHH